MIDHEEANQVDFCYYIMSAPEKVVGKTSYTYDVGSAQNVAL